MAVFCLKAVRYCMYMWLPMYLLNYVSYFPVFFSILLSSMCNNCSENLENLLLDDEKMHALVDRQCRSRSDSFFSRSLIRVTVSFSLWLLGSVINCFK